MHSKLVAWVIQAWLCLTISEECGTKKMLEKWEMDRKVRSYNSKLC